MKLREKNLCESLRILAAGEAKRTDLPLLNEGSHSVTQNFFRIRENLWRTETNALVSDLNIILENGPVKR